MKALQRLSLALFLIPALVSGAFGEDRLKLATTTSTQNSGLLEALLPPFEQEYGIKVDVIAVGTGKAIKLAEAGDVDIVMVHARSKEDAFVAAGYGVNRRDVMYNDFVIIGPPGDPAGLKGTTAAAAALKKIAAAQARFISRGDDSGTHTKEKGLWKAAGIAPAGDWYIEAGRGMGEVINMADQQLGYTLADRGTYIAYQDKVDLVVLTEGDEKLFNPYGVIAVNPKKHPHVNYDAAMLLIAYLTSPEGQKRIADYQMNGQQLFFIYK